MCSSSVDLPAAPSGLSVLTEMTRSLSKTFCPVVTGFDQWWYDRWGGWAARLMFAVFCFSLAIGFGWEGVERGQRYGMADVSRTLYLLVKRMEMVGEPNWFPRYLAHGITDAGETTSVEVFRRQYENISPGEKIKVFHCKDR